jgi:hypothetical protein
MTKPFNFPLAPAQVGHAARTPLQVVGQECHLPLLPVHSHPHDQSAHQLRGGPVRVAQNDVWSRSIFSFLDGGIFRITS